MKILVWLISLNALLSVPLSASTPISGKELFRNPETFTMKLNPQGSLILSYGHGEGENFFELIEPRTEKGYLVLKVSPNSKIRLLGYQWVDDKTVYIDLDERKGFLHIDVSKATPKVEFKALKSKGYLVSTLPKEENMVLFSLDVGKYKTRYALVKVPVDKLENNTAKQEDYKDLSLKGSSLYFYDDLNDRYMSATLKNDQLTFWLRNKEGSKWIDYWTVDKSIDFLPVGFLSENKLAVLTNHDEDLISLREFDLDKQALGKVLYKHPMYDLVDAELEPYGAGVKSVRYIDNGVPTTDYFAVDIKKRKKKIRRTFKNQQMSVVSANKDNSKQIVLIHDSDNPGRFYLYDDPSNTAQYLKDRAPWLSSYELAKSETLKIEVEENVNVESILTRPVGDGNGVLLVYPHGGPIGVRDYAIYDRKIQYLASRGYSVLMINFRGSSGFGKKFLERGKGQFGQLIEKDISAVVRFVKSQHQFKHTCAIGASYGGYSAAMLAIAHPQEYQCVIGMYGVYDLPLLFNASNYEAREESRESLAEIVGELDDSLKAVSPFYLAQKLNVPTLLIAGEDDEIAYPEHTNRMKYRMEQLSKDVEAIFYKGVAHGHNKLTGENHQFAYIHDFIKRKLKLADVIDDNAKPALANDSVLIADAYSFDSFLPINLSKGLRYYRRAAALGENRAMYNIGSFYHQGKVVEKDIDTAVSWYKKSSDAGYARASYRLATLSTEGLLVLQDFDYAYQQLLLATEQDKNFASAEIGVTRALCLGEGTEVNGEKCLKRLFYVDDHSRSPSKLRGQARKDWESAFSRVLMLNKFNPKLKEKLRTLTQEEFKLSTLAIKAKERGYGLYAYRNKNAFEKTLSSKTVEVPIIKDTLFGVTLSFKPSLPVDRKQKNWSMIKYVWTPPEAIANRIEYTYQTVSEYRELDIRFSLSQDYELIAGNWTLQVYSLNDELIYEKTFQTK